MRRHIGLALLTAALSVLLTGCLFRSTEDLYALPERFPGYEDLTGKRSEIQAGLEMEYGTTVETAVIYSGDNTSVIQFQDMDGDGCGHLLPHPGGGALPAGLFPHHPGRHRAL